jgi:hypothetical protein
MHILITLLFVLLATAQGRTRGPGGAITALVSRNSLCRLLTIEYTQTGDSTLTDSSVWVSSSSCPAAQFRSVGSRQSATVTGSASPDVGAWNLSAGTYNGAKVAMHAVGVATNSTPTSDHTASVTPRNTVAAFGSGGACSGNGKLVYLTVVCSSGWIAAEYGNKESGSTSLTMGGEVL